MASILGLRHLVRGTVSPRVVGGLPFRCFAAGSQAGAQRPVVPPPGPPPSNPTPRPPAKPTIQPGAAVSRPGLPTPPAKPVPPTEPTGTPAPVATAAASSKPKTPSGRDPERPKRPATSWLRYLANFRKQNTSLKGAEVMRAAAIKWKVLTAEQRKPYVTPYEADKKVYEKAFAEYVSSGKKDAWQRDPEQPKRPISGFLRFAGEYRAKNPTLKLTEAAAKAGVLWRSMTSGAKAPYEQKYAAEKVEFDKSMQMYKDSGKEAAYKAKKGLTVAEKRKAKEVAQKEKEMAKQIKLKAAAAKRKESDAAKQLKKKEVEAKRKEKEAAKKMKAKEAAAKQKEKDSAIKLKAKEATAAAKHATVKQATM